MPQIKSQIKRVRTNNKRNAVVTSEQSAIKTAIKAVLKAVELNDKEAAVVAYNKVNSMLDSSITSGAHHKNYASRVKARLSKRVNSIA